MKKLKGYFSKFEYALYFSAVFIIVSFFIVFDKRNFINLFASLIGVTSLIFCAKGNPLGPLFSIIFSVFYGIISFAFSYYGEMITYLGMTAPMALFSLISWLKNPFEKNKAEVTVNKIKGKEVFFMSVLAVIVTIIFYFILKAFDTAKLIPSTLSVTTSFLAVYLTFRRSEYFALSYAANDVVLIVLWVMASLKDISCISVVVCFVVFLILDIYSFINWKKMYRRQHQSLRQQQPSNTPFDS